MEMQSVPLMRSIVIRLISIRRCNLPKYQTCRLTSSLVSSWEKVPLHPDLRRLLNARMDLETAEEIRQALETLGLPERWKFAKKWYSEKHGAIFMLKERRDSLDVSFDSTENVECHDQREHCDNDFGSPERQSEIGILGTA